LIVVEPPAVKVSAPETVKASFCTLSPNAYCAAAKTSTNAVAIAGMVCEKPFIVPIYEISFIKE
jgi:hypothetical protein